MTDYHMVEWDRDVFPTALEADGDAQDCFLILRTLFDEVMHQTIRESFTVQMNVRNIGRSTPRCSEATFVVAVREPAMPSQGTSWCLAE
jgi:hypothetical protein